MADLGLILSLDKTLAKVSPVDSKIFTKYSQSQQVLNNICFSLTTVVMYKSPPN